MVKTTDTDLGHGDPPRAGASISASEVQAWFVREVLPLEAALMQFLRRIRHNKIDVDDLCQDVYVRVCETALTEIPRSAKSFVFTVARNIVVDEMRREQIVPIDAVADLDVLHIAADTPGPDQSVIARDELRRLQVALDELPPRCREAVVMRKIQDLPRREIAVRMNITEKTVSRHIAEGICALADRFYGETTSDRRRT
jgi:RNA polymerase sigma factor (sigma-70 family)